MCSYLVASRNMRSNWAGSVGRSSGAWPRIWVMKGVSSALAKFSFARLNLSFLWDSMVWSWWVLLLVVVEGSGDFFLKASAIQIPETPLLVPISRIVRISGFVRINS